MGCFWHPISYYCAKMCVLQPHIMFLYHFEAQSSVYWLRVTQVKKRFKKKEYYYFEWKQLLIKLFSHLLWLEDTILGGNWVWVACQLKKWIQCKNTLKKIIKRKKVIQKNLKFIIFLFWPTYSRKLIKIFTKCVKKYCQYIPLHIFGIESNRTKNQIKNTFSIAVKTPGHKPTVKRL